MAGGSKIQFFKLTQKVCQAIEIFPPTSNKNRNFFNSKYLFFLFGNVICCTSSAAYLLIEANSMIEYGIVFFLCATSGLSITLYLIFIWQRNNILNYIKKSEEFIENRVHSKAMYKITNEKIEQCTEFFAHAMTATIMIVLLFPLIYSIINYCILDLEEESFFLFYLTWWPFDWRTPFGYLLVWLAQCAGIAATVIIGIPCFNITLGSCWLFIVMAEDITNDMATVNNIIKILEDIDRGELMEGFGDLIQHYSDAKQLINGFNEMCEYLLLTMFSWDMLSLSSSLMTLQFQLWDNGSNLFGIVIMSMSILWSFAINLVMCEAGERVTKQFDQFYVELSQCEWNKLPIEMQRMYLIFVSDVQQPKYLRSYGGILCTRETFKRITTKGFSYFMTLRKFRE